LLAKGDFAVGDADEVGIRVERDRQEEKEGDAREGAEARRFGGFVAALCERRGVERFL
jgi:hypothetical protein